MNEDVAYARNTESGCKMKGIINRIFLVFVKIKRFIL